MQKKLEQLLQQEDIQHEIIEHEAVVTMEDVERILKIPRNTTAKTLVVKLRDSFVIVVLRGDCRLDKKKLADILGISRKHLDLVKKEEVEKLMGVPLGAIPPFGFDHPVVMDEKVTRLDWVFCGFGSLTRTLKIQPKDIVNLTKAIIGDISS